MQGLSARLDLASIAQVTNIDALLRLYHDVHWRALDDRLFDYVIVSITWLLIHVVMHFSLSFGIFSIELFSNFQIFSKVDFRSFLNFDACVNDRTCRKGCSSEDLQTLGFQLLIGTSLFEYEWGFSFRMECIQWCDAMCTDPYVHDLVEFNLTFDGLAVAISNAILNVSTKTSADFQIQLS